MRHYPFIKQTTSKWSTTHCASGVPRVSRTRG